MNLAVINIKELIVDTHKKKKLAGEEMKHFERLNDAFLIVENGKFADFGKMKNFDFQKYRNYEIIKADGRLVMPTFTDSHTHIVYAGSREKEFVYKIQGLTYEEIAKRGGGILNSAKLLHDTSEDELYNQAAERIKEVMKMGTGAIEIKSGYGLNTQDELKMLRVIKRLKDNFPLTIKSTFLGAHSIPMEYRSDTNKYVDIVVNEMIPAVGSEKLADFVDVFCDRGFFTPEQTDRILKAAAKYGMRPKIHANELGFTGGVQVGVKNNALSVDHLEYVDTEEINVLLDSETMPTVLPSTSFYLNLKYAPARKMIEAGLPVAIASDYNPGSSPSGNMKFVFSLATIKLKLLPEEAFNAMTLNTAYAMGISEQEGTIAIGKKANFIITKPIPSFEFIPYAFGSDLFEMIFINGEKVL